VRNPRQKSDKAVRPTNEQDYFLQLPTTLFSLFIFRLKFWKNNPASKNPQNHSNVQNGHGETNRKRRAPAFSAWVKRSGSELKHYASAVRQGRFPVNLPTFSFSFIPVVVKFWNTTPPAKSVEPVNAPKSGSGG
jgi:hypothetical protein